jgi:3-oxoacyl-[acyl-carrier protein] reductase
MLPDAGAQIALVGGAGGIGRALTVALVAAGCAPLVLDLPASLAAHPPGVPAAPVDVTDAATLRNGFAALLGAGGALDGLVLLAGFTAPLTPLADLSEDRWDEVVGGNLRGAFLAARAGLPFLRRGQAPSLVTVASGLAFRGTPGYGPYSAAKAGVVSLTRTLAAEEAPAMRVNCVAPSAVRTAFLTGGTGRAARDSNFDAARYAQAVPLGRVAEAEDVVGPILFLLGPASAYMTAQILHVNGGQHAG